MTIDESISMTHQDPVAAPPAVAADSFRSGSLHSRALVIGFLVVALALRLFHLGYQNLWADEGISAHFARGSLGESLTKVTQYDISPPLYILVLNWWTDCFGTSDTALRLPSALFSWATVLLVWLVARRLFGWRAALFSLILATFSLHSIYYGQEARPYALLGLLTTASMAVYLGLRRRTSWPRIALLALINGTMLYVNYFGLFVIAAQAGHVLLGCVRLRQASDGQLRVRTLVIVNMISLLWFLPWIGQCLRNVDRFREESYLQVPGLEKLFLAFAMMLSKWAYGWLPLYLTAGLIIALVVAVVLSIPARTRPVVGWLWSPLDPEVARQHAGSAQLLVLWLLLPVLVAWSVSHFGIRVFDVKVLSVAAPALLILLGYFSSRLQWQLPALGILALLATDSVQHYRRNYYQPHKPRYQAAMEYLARQTGSPNLVVCDPEYSGLTAHHYVDASTNKVVAMHEAIRSPAFWLLEIKQGDPKKVNYLRRLGYRRTERARFPKIKVWHWTR